MALFRGLASTVGQHFRMYLILAQKILTHGTFVLTPPPARLDHSRVCHYCMRRLDLVRPTCQRLFVTGSPIPPGVIFCCFLSLTRLTTIIFIVHLLKTLEQQHVGQEITFRNTCPAQNWRLHGLEDSIARVLLLVDSDGPTRVKIANTYDAKVLTVVGSPRRWRRSAEQSGGKSV